MGAIGTLAVLAAGAYLLNRSGGGGASLFGGGKQLYQPTDADITQIMSRYSNGGSRFTVCNVINGARTCHTLSEWMRLSIQQLQALTYQGDSFCSGMGGAPRGVGLATGFQAYATGAGIIGGPIVGAITQIESAIIGFVVKHHAVAVALENKILCALVPQVNSAFAQVYSGMKDGTINGVNAKNAIENIRLEVQKSVAMDAHSGALQAEQQVASAVCDAFQLIIARSSL